MKAGQARVELEGTGVYLLLRTSHTGGATYWDCLALCPGLSVERPGQVVKLNRRWLEGFTRPA